MEFTVLFFRHVSPFPNGHSAFMSCFCFQFQLFWLKKLQYVSARKPSSVKQDIYWHKGATYCQDNWCEKTFSRGFWKALPCSFLLQITSNPLDESILVRLCFCLSYTVWSHRDCSFRCVLMLWNMMTARSYKYQSVTLILDPQTMVCYIHD